MRMWMIDPKLLCRKHLLGEHSEIHKHKHNFLKGHSIKGRIYPITQIEPLSMQYRHEQLSQEMLLRKYNHQSPFEQPSLEKYTPEDINVKVDKNIALKDLSERCSECRKRIHENQNNI